MYTELRIPTVAFGNSKPYKAHTNIPAIMENIRQKLFTSKTGLLSVKNLSENIRRIRLPDPLSRSIINLYNDYGRQLSDPFLFDSVLDLLDTFITVHQLLTKSLPAKLIMEAKSDSLCRCFICDEDIESLSDLVELLRDALAHRTQFAFRDAEKWNAAVDIKGNGLDRILSAMDAPLKCALRTLRRVMNGSTDAYKPPVELHNRIDSENKKKIGGACRISPNLRSFSKRLYFSLDPDVFLVSVDLNVAHLGRPSALCIHLHEGAHLIFHLLAQKDPEIFLGEYRKNHRYESLNCTEKLKYDNMIRERHEDIFAEMLVFCFVFEGDHEAYLRNFMVNYSFDPVSYNSDTELMFKRLLEVFIRGFLVTDPFREKRKKIYSADSDSAVALDDIIQVAQDDFWKTAKQIGPFFIEFSRLWIENDPEFRDYVNKHLRYAYEDSFYVVRDIWQCVQKIYDSVCKGGNDKIEADKHGTDPSDATFRKNLNRDIKKGFAYGRPMIRMLCEIPGRQKLVEADRFLNSFYLIRQMLKEYVIELYEGINIENTNIDLGRDMSMGALKPATDGRVKTGQ